jgi:hypothetical protein
VETHSELLAAAQKLAQLSQQHAEQDVIDKQTELVSELSKSAGTNVVVQEINDGTFKGYTLSVSETFGCSTPDKCDHWHWLWMPGSAVVLRVAIT